MLITTIVIRVQSTDHIQCFDLNTRFKQQDGVSTMDIMIRRSLYWPDGKLMRSKSCVMERNNDQMCRLVQALVDQYNEHHNLFGVHSLSHALY